MARFHFPQMPLPSVLPLEESVIVNGLHWCYLDKYLLHPYLAQHPLRIQELLRVLPEASEGLKAHWKISDEGCVLERVVLLENNDPLAELLIWGALFPGLQKPLAAWWFTGRITPDANFHCSKDRVADIARGEVRYIGAWRREECHWSEEGFHVWPFWARLAILPILIPLSPFAYLAMLRQEIKDFKHFKFSLLLGVPLIFLFFPFYFLFPEWLQPLADRLVRPLRVELDIIELQENALS